MHPGIVAPPYDQVEVKFWTDPSLYKQGLEYYLDKMPAASDNHMVVVKVPGVETSRVHQPLVHKDLPQAKIILGKFFVLKLELKVPLP